MARWVLYENNRNHLTLLYENATNGRVFNCGELRRDTPEQMIVQWVLEQEAAQPGDLISLRGRTVQLLSTLARA